MFLLQAQLGRKKRTHRVLEPKDLINRIRNGFLCGPTTAIMTIVAIIVITLYVLMFHHPRFGVRFTPPRSTLDIHGNCNPIWNAFNLTTLVIMSYTNNEALMKVLSQYNDCTLFGGIIYEIVIVWNNPELRFNFSHELLLIDNKTHTIRINVYQQNKNSLANRWFISRHHNFQTSSALFIDDDMFINQYAISCMQATFLRNKDKIIAPSHTYLRTTRQLDKTKDSETGKMRWLYQNTFRTDFNMLLPGMSMFGTSYLPKLALTLEEYELLPIIDEQIAHCDDISMMLSMSMLNDGRKYLLGIDYVLIEDYSVYRKQEAMTDKSQIKLRYQQRSECLTMIMDRFVSVNKQKRKEIINPIINHERRDDTINCRTCLSCDYRGCWFKLI